MSIKMTDKRAICILKWLLDSVDEDGRIDVGSWYHGIDRDFKESLSVAIKALEFQDKVKEAYYSSCGFEFRSYIREMLKDDQKEHNCCYWDKTTNGCILGYHKYCPDNYNCEDYD